MLTLGAGSALREQFVVADSCRVRCFCPFCHEKRALEKAGWVAEHVCAQVPHRQFVFTIPKRLRIYFRFERRLLGELCRAAARTVITVYHSASGRPDAVPGVIGAIQTFGQLVHFHPHIHALVTEGVFLPESGAFLALPEEDNAVGRFPEPGDEELVAGPSRNFQVFDPLDFLAEVTQHIPDAGEHLIRYYAS